MSRLFPATDPPYNATWVVGPFMKWGQHPPMTYAEYDSGCLPCIWHPAGSQVPNEMKLKSNGYEIRRWIWDQGKVELIFFSFHCI